MQPVLLINGSIYFKCKHVYAEMDSSTTVNHDHL